LGQALAPSLASTVQAMHKTEIFGRSWIPLFLLSRQRIHLTSIFPATVNCSVSAGSLLTGGWFFDAGWCKAMRISSWPARVYVIDYDVTSMGSLPNLHALSAADRPPISRPFEAPRHVVRHHLVRAVWTIRTALPCADTVRVVVISYRRFGSLPRRVSNVLQLLAA